MIPARSAGARAAAALPGIVIVLGVVMLAAAAFGTIAEDRERRAERAARPERWATGPLRTERNFMRSAKLRRPGDAP